MSNDNCSDKGYTLIEAIVVLFIVSTLGSIAFISLTPLSSSYDEEMFLQQLSQDIHYTQQLALSTSTTTTLSIEPHQKQYSIIQNNNIVFTRRYDETIEFLPRTLSLQISFLANGNISRAGTLKIKTAHNEYDLVFMIGKGRFYIEKT